MADNVTLPGAAEIVAADDVGGGVKEQWVKLSLGADNAHASLVDAAAPTVLLPVSGGIVKRMTVTPTISTSIYAAGDAIGGKLTFSNAARASGGGIIIDAATLVDNDSEQALIELVLFDRDFTATTDNAAFDPTDADLANIITIIPMTVYSAFLDNAAAYRYGLGISAKLNAADLFGQMVVRSAPTYTATSDLTIILQVRQL